MRRDLGPFGSAFGCSAGFGRSDKSIRCAFNVFARANSRLTAGNDLPGSLDIFLVCKQVAGQQPAPLCRVITNRGIEAIADETRERRGNLIASRGVAFI